MAIETSDQFANLVTVGVDSHLTLVVTQYHLADQKAQIAHLVLVERYHTQCFVCVEGYKLIFHADIADFD